MRSIVPILFASLAILQSYLDGILVVLTLCSYPSRYLTLQDLGAALLALPANHFVLDTTKKTV